MIAEEPLAFLSLEGVNLQGIMGKCLECNALQGIELRFEFKNFRILLINRCFWLTNEFEIKTKESF
jgi:hypothetical protein